MNVRSLFLVFPAAVFALASCTAQPVSTSPSPEVVAAYEVAREQDSIEAYEKFLEGFSSSNSPDMTFRNKARSRLVDLRELRKRQLDDEAWNEAARADSMAAYEAYLDTGFRRHREAAERGIARAMMRNAFASKQIAFSFQEELENAPAGRSLSSEFAGVAKDVLSVAGLRVVDATTPASADELVLTVQVVGDAWQEEWQSPRKPGESAPHRVKLWTGYKVDIEPSVAIEGIRFAGQTLSFPASEGFTSAQYFGTTALSEFDIERFTQPAGIFARGGPRLRGSVDTMGMKPERQLRVSLMRLLLDAYGCDMALLLGSTDRVPRHPWSNGSTRPDREWLDDLTNAIVRDPELRQSPTSCELSLDLWLRMRVVEQSVARYYATRTGRECACPYMVSSSLVNSREICDNARIDAWTSGRANAPTYCYALDVPTSELMAIRSDASALLNLPATPSHVCSLDDLLAYVGLPPTCSAFRYGTLPVEEFDDQGRYTVVSTHRPDYGNDTVVTEATFLAGRPDPVKQVCYHQERNKAEKMLAQLSNGEVVYSAPGKSWQSQDFIDKHCRFTDLGRPRP